MTTNFKKLLFQTIYFSFVRCLIPLITFIGKIKLPFVSKEEIMDEFYNIQNILQPGDILLTNSSGHLSNLLNPSHWKHCTIYVGIEDNIPYIVEAVGKGVVKKQLVSWLGSKDKISIVRTEPIIMTTKQIPKMIKFIKDQLGKPYDYTFDSVSENTYSTFYCSELAYFGIKHANPDCNFNMRSENFWGVSTVLPSDFYDAKTKFKHVYEFAV
jgi:uncharacterized protein YycO